MHFGRKKKLTLQQMDKLRHRREQGVLIKTLMKDYRLSKASVYRYVGETDSSQSAKTTYPPYSTFSRGWAKIPNIRHRDSDCPGLSGLLVGLAH